MYVFKPLTQHHYPNVVSLTTITQCKTYAKKDTLYPHVSGVAREAEAKRVIRERLG